MKGPVPTAVRRRSPRLLDHLPRNDRRPVPRHARQERRARLLGVDAHGVLVGDLDLLDGARSSRDRPSPMLRIQDPLVGELHVVGDQLPAVVEFHPAAKLEGPRPAVRHWWSRTRPERGLELAVRVPTRPADCRTARRSAGGRAACSRIVSRLGASVVLAEMNVPPILCGRGCAEAAVTERAAAAVTSERKSRRVIPRRSAASVMVGPRARSSARR